MPQALKTSAIAASLCIAYVVTAQLGFHAAFVADQVTTVWAPTGIAQAALLLWGVRLWPAVWLGAFAANALTDIPWWAASGIATGNTLEAVATALILSRVLGFDPALRRTRDAVAFLVVAVAAATMISATAGTAILCAAGNVPWSRYPELWREWWSGDALGALIVAPAILTTFRGERQSRRRIVEAAALVLAAAIAAAALTGRFFSPSVGEPPPFVVLPFVIVAAVRLGQPAAAWVTLGAATVTVWNTFAGYRPFGATDVHGNLLLVNAFMAVLAGCGLLLAAAITERRVLERRRAAAYAAGNVIAGASSLEEIAPRVLQAIGANLGWQAGRLWIVHSTLGKLHCVAVWADDEQIAAELLTATRDLTFARGVGLPGRTRADCTASWIESIDGHPLLRGAFAFPIHYSHEVTGVAEFFSESVAGIDRDLLTTVASIGNQIGEFLGRKQIETKVSDEQTRTRAILETALDAIITMDDRGCITEFNRAAERMFGYSREQAIGRELAVLIIPKALRAGHRNGLANFLRTGEGPFINRRIDTTAARSDGREFPVEVSITKVPTVPPVFTGFVRDVTDRVNAEKERRTLLDAELAARREAEGANRAKDEFLATLSHELRTPLNAIVGWTRMLLDGMLDETNARRALAIIDRNAHAQAQLVTDLLDVSRIITGKLSLNLGPVDVGSIVGAALDTVRPAANAKRIRIASRLTGSVQLTNGDFQRLQQVVWNLLTNAIKFTPEGGLIEVELAELGTDRLRLTITDSGAGIDPAFLPHVFDRFRQADGSSTRHHGGLGLGLAIVRHLIEQHGGTACARSEGVGKGASFTVELPRLIEESIVPLTPVLRPREARRNDDRPLQGCRILVVEDDEDARQLLSTVLSGAGATVRETASVDEALGALTEEAADVIFTDIGLPGKDGYALLRELRAGESAGSQAPMAAVTAYAREEDRDSVRAAGFASHISKPVDVHIVVQTAVALWKRTGSPWTPRAAL